MKILSAENNVSYTANNAVKIYIIKQVDYSQKKKFEEDYAPLINGISKSKSFVNKTNPISTEEKDIKLTCLLDYDFHPYPSYTACPIASTPDRPRFKVNGNESSYFYFLSSLYQLRNCPLIDFSQLAYVFQMDGQAQGGLANVVSFNVNFSVNGQSSAEIVLNNKDFKYNFKYFNNKEKYPFHLKSYFDTNDIIIIRYQKKNKMKDNLLNSFKSTHIDDWKDPYIDPYINLDGNVDPFTTIFTGYINDINDSFSFNNGNQTVTLNCTGPSKRLTWTRFLSNRAAASKDSLSAILPLSAYVNPQTFNNENKASIKNSEVISNLIVRTYSGVLNIPKVKEAFDTFTQAFDENNNIQTSSEIKDLEDKIKDLDVKKDIKAIEKYNQELQQRKSDLQDKIRKSRDVYNETIKANMSTFIDENKSTGTISIKGNKFAVSDTFGDTPNVFKIEGTDQPAYTWTFNNWSSLFKSDFSTVYQFIKGVADYLQFNFYDDPYGTIHFSIPDMTLAHLNNDNHPNNLTQISSFSETQNTENIANVQFCEAKYVYDLPFDMINTVAKDYRSIAKYGEKMMQPFSMIGLTNPAAIRYAARMRMAKYNRKALSNIRVVMNGEPYLKIDKYAYIKSLRKLFYIESYSHSYNAGGQFTTSLNGTYTRDILALVDIKKSNTKVENFSKILTSSTSPSTKLSLTSLSSIRDDIANKIQQNSLDNQLKNSSTMNDIFKVLNTLEFPNHEILAQKVYQIYIDNWKYPTDDENLKFDIGAMYTAKNLRQCYLDGFFWALPFDVNPYAIAQQIQEDERKARNQLVKTKNVKVVSKLPTVHAPNIKTNIPEPQYVIKNLETGGTTGLITKKELMSGMKKYFNEDEFNLSKYNKILSSKKMTIKIIYEPKAYKFLQSGENK